MRNILAAGFCILAGQMAFCPVTQAQRPRAGSPAATASSTIAPASLHGARIFIKYSITYYPTAKTNFDHLILFPSGAAFADIPTKPIAQFDEATLRASLNSYDIGMWKQVGSNIALSFPDKSSDKTRVLHKVAKGWFDGSGQPKPDSPYDIYYPVVPLTSKVLTGPWITKSLTVLGTEGGGTAMVAAGSTGNRVFYANGTYSDDRDSFVSATTANMPSMYKGNSNVYANSSGKKSESGEWRIDGPLLTLQHNKEHIVCVAFAMPNWGEASKPDVMIDGDRWKRPEKK